MRLLKRRRADAVQRDQKATDDALMKEHQAAIEVAAEKRGDRDAAGAEYHEIEQTGRGRVMAAAEKHGKAWAASQTASAAEARLEQQVRSSDAVDPLVREGGPVITALCTLGAHIQRHGQRKLAQYRVELRDLKKLGIEPYTVYPSGVVNPMSVELGRLEREIPLAAWAEKHQPAFLSALQAVRSLQLVRGVDFPAAVTAILKTLPQRCTCGKDFALEVPTNAVEAA